MKVSLVLRLFPNINSLGNKRWERRVPAAAVIHAPQMEDTFTWSKMSVVFGVRLLKKTRAQPGETLKLLH